MSKSRLTIALILISTPSAAFAQSDPLTIHFRLAPGTPVIDCPRGSADADSIVVCGRRDEADPNRLPLPVAAEPGRRIPGEPAGGAAFTCLSKCYQPLRIDLIKAAKVTGKVVRHLLGKDD